MTPVREVVVVQARMGSSRLPGKSLMPLAGRPLIAHVLERALALGATGGVVLATSSNPRDDALAAAVAGLGRGVPVVRGPEQDVLERVWLAAVLARAEVVVRVTGDCPLWAPDVGRAALESFCLTGADYVWNDTARSGYPDGTDVEVFTRDALERAREEATEQLYREHVTPWMRERLRCGTVYPSGPDLSHCKWSVDRAEDFERVRRIYGHLRAGELALADTVAAARRAGEPV